MQGFRRPIPDARLDRTTDPAYYAGVVLPPHSLARRVRRALVATLLATGCYTGVDPDGNAEGGGDGSDGVELRCDPDAPRGSIRDGRRLTREEYTNVIADLFGLPASDRFPGPSGKSITGYSTEPALGVVGEQSVEDLMYAAEDAAEALAPALADVLPCAADAADDACAQTFLDTIGRRAFRRSLTDSERSMLLAIYTAERSDDADFADAIAVMTAQMLQMPAFIYLMEDPAESGEDRPLSGLELATRLSFYVWASIPDDALLDRAEAGELDSADAVMEEARRMFADKRARRGLARFFREWTQAPALQLRDKTASLFPYLDEAFVASVNTSFELYVEDLVKSNASLRDLLVSPHTFVDASLAEFHGLDAVDGWKRVELPADRYVGIMTHPMVLAGLAHATEASYVFRGRFVRRRLLCEAPLTPPGNAMSAFNQIEKPEDPTARDLSDLVRARPDCSACHQLIDPPGLALEHFDAMGAYRDAYATGKAIDTADRLLGAGDPLEFEGPVDLVGKLVEMPEVAECFSRQVFRFAASRMETEADGCALTDIDDALGDADGSLADAFLAIPATDGFMYRRGE